MSEKKDTERPFLKVLIRIFGNESRAKLVQDLTINLVRAEVRINALEKLLNSEGITTQEKLDKHFNEALDKFMKNFPESFFVELMRSSREEDNATEENK